MSRWLVVLGLATVAACDAREIAERNEAAREAAAQADTVQIANEAYDLVRFDTIDWGSESFVLGRGKLVWQVSCAKCHGEGGEGDAGFVLKGDTLRPPSFLAPEWKYATQLDSLRRYIFKGNTEGMPHWGLIPMTPYDIGVVAVYIQKGLRMAR